MFADRHFVILATTILFTLPLSLYRDIAKLGKVFITSSTSYPVGVKVSCKQSALKSDAMLRYCDSVLAGILDFHGVDF